MHDGWLWKRIVKISHQCISARFVVPFVQTKGFKFFEAIHTIYFINTERPESGSSPFPSSFHSLMDPYTFDFDNRGILPVVHGEMDRPPTPEANPHTSPSASNHGPPDGYGSPGVQFYS